MNIYEVNRLSATLIGIGERCSQYLVNAMYLVIGKERAALVDTGLGLTGDLDKFVRKFTDLPIVVLNTHADPDHIGSNALFEDIHLSSRDATLIPWAMGLEARLGDLPSMTGGNTELCGYAKTHIAPEKRFAYTDISDGERFDLGGGCVLEAIATPGHSQGSLCFFNRNEHYVLTGDTIVPYPWLWLDRCAPLAEYAASVRRFKAIVGVGPAMYCGHSIEALSPLVVDDLVVGCEELIAGETGTDKPFKVPYAIDISAMKVMQHDCDQAHIIYNAYKM